MMMHSLAGNHCDYSICEVTWVDWLDSQPRWHTRITTVIFHYVFIWYTNNNYFNYLPLAECEQTEQPMDDNAELDKEVPKCSRHRRGSTEGYDVEGRMTPDHLHTDRQTTHIAVQRVTMLTVVWPWTTYTQTDRPPTEQYRRLRCWGSYDPGPPTHKTDRPPTQQYRRLQCYREKDTYSQNNCLLSVANHNKKNLSTVMTCPLSQASKCLSNTL